MRVRITAIPLLALAVFPSATFGSTAHRASGAPRSRSLGALGTLAAGVMRTRARQSGISLTPSTTEPYWACPDGPCDAIVDPRPVWTGHQWRLPATGAILEGSGELGGFDPQDLQAAYQIPAAGGTGQTVAAVDAFGYPGAEEDLSRYRERYGLPPCTSANGCFTKVNESGEEADYPPAEEEGWEDESALDLDMASAACLDATSCSSRPPPHT